MQHNDPTFGRRAFLLGATLASAALEAQTQTPAKPVTAGAKRQRKYELSRGWLFNRKGCEGL